MTAAEALDGIEGVGGARMPRALVVMAHPDDEVLAVGGRMERMAGCRFVCVTDGAPVDGFDARAHGFGSVEAYRRARRGELECALGVAGLPGSCAVELRMEDGTVVPDQGAAERMVGVARAVRREVEGFRPEVVLTHPYEGGHPDHDAVAFGVWAAVRGMERGPVVVVEAAGYHAGTGGETVWMKTGEFLPFFEVEERVVELTEGERERKRAMLGCFVSQGETLAQFGVERERFRVAPVYDWGRAPHGGVLFYEAYAFGMRGEGWREMARAARREMGL